MKLEDKTRHGAKVHKDGKHSVFGQLIGGMDVLEQIKNGDATIHITIEEK